MWFDEIMDDCKNALRIANQNKGIFIPIFIKLGLTLLLGLLMFICFVGYAARLIGLFSNNLSDYKSLIGDIPFILTAGIIIYLLFLACNSVIEGGSVNLIKTAEMGIKPKFSHFFDGVKNYFLKIFGGNLFILLIVLILSPILICLYLLYAVLVGTLTSGWGLIYLSVLIAVYFTSWTTAVVVDGLSPLKAIGISFKLGKKYFWGLFIIMLSSMLISQYISVVFGPLVAVIGGWLIGGVILTYFKLVVLMIYNRKREELL